MKIQLPNQLKDIDKLTEGEIMFVAFFYMICSRYGYNTRYNINVGDLRRIVFNFKAHSQGIFGNHFANLREIFEFAQTDEYNVLVQFRDIAPKGIWGRPVTKKNSKMSVGPMTHELKELSSIKLWSYLMGMWHSGNEIVTESDKIFEHETNYRISEGLEYRNFTIE